jgi:hypothetical protein
LIGSSAVDSCFFCGLHSAFGSVVNTHTDLAELLCSAIASEFGDSSKLSLSANDWERYTTMAAVFASKAVAASPWPHARSVRCWDPLDDRPAREKLFPARAPALKAMPPSGAPNGIMATARTGVEAIAVAKRAFGIGTRVEYPLDFVIVLSLTKSHSGPLWLLSRSWTIGCRGKQRRTLTHASSRIAT